MAKTSTKFGQHHFSKVGWGACSGGRWSGPRRKRPNPENCGRGSYPNSPQNACLSPLGPFCETPAACRLAQNDLEKPTRTSWLVYGRDPCHNSMQRRSSKKNKEQNGNGREKSAKFWAPTLRAPHPLGPHFSLHPSPPTLWAPTLRANTFRSSPTLLNFEFCPRDGKFSFSCEKRKCGPFAYWSFGSGEVGGGKVGREVEVVVGWGGGVEYLLLSLSLLGFRAGSKLEILPLSLKISFPAAT